MNKDLSAKWVLIGGGLRSDLHRRCGRRIRRLFKRRGRPGLQIQSTWHSVAALAGERPHPPQDQRK